MLFVFLPSLIDTDLFSGLLECTLECNSTKGAVDISYSSTWKTKCLWLFLKENIVNLSPV